MVDLPFILLSFLLITVARVNSIQTVNGKIKITLGTTAGCEDTARFIENQLLPTYGQYKQFLDVELVPWGRTVRHGNGTLSCEFGESDCWANRVHRCVLHHLQGILEAQMSYIVCEFISSYSAYKQMSYRCALNTGIRLVNLDFCVNNPQRDTLDQKAEAASVVPTATIGQVPYVLFNDVISLENSLEAHRRLSSVICFALADDVNSGIRGCQI